MGKLIRISVVTDKKEKERLEKKAKALERSLSWYCDKILREHG